MALVQALYRTGQWKEAETQVRELLASDDANVDYLGLDGRLAARLENPQKARAVSSELARTGEPHLWGWHTYERARIAALLGEKDEAVDLLREALAQGLAAYESIHRDPDLESLRDYPPFQELVRVDSGP
jgi:predicted Zn-dependent protease